MYKRAQRFQDFMSRSNAFVDRILAGGNHLNTDEITAETDVDLLLDAFARLKEVYVTKYDRAIKAKQEKAEINNLTKGMPDFKLTPEMASRRRRMIEYYRKAMDDLRHVDAHMDLIRGRLLTLKVDLPSENPLPRGKLKQVDYGAKKQRKQAREGFNQRRSARAGKMQIGKSWGKYVR